MKYLVFCCLLLASLLQAAPSGLDLLTAPGSPLLSGDRLIFVGDSITAGAEVPTGFVTLVRKALAQRPDLHVVILSDGTPGMRATGIAGYHTNIGIRPHQPSIVFYYIGVNDVWHREKRFGGRGSTPEEYEAALRSTITALQASGTVVVLATPAVIGEQTDGTNDMRHAMPGMPTKDDAPVPADAPLDQYCAISRKVAIDLGVELCDLRSAFQTYLKTHNAENKEAGVLTVDGVHLNPLGNALVADEAAASIVRALRRTSSRLLVPADDATRANVITNSEKELSLNQRQECRLAPATIPILARTGHVEIHYSLDGTAPTAASPRYDAPLVLPAKDGKETVYPLQVLGIDKDDGASTTLAMTITALPPLPASGAPAEVISGLRYEEFAPGAPEAVTRKVVDSLALKPETRVKGARYRYSGWLEIPAAGIYLLRTQAEDTFTVTLDDAWRHTQTGHGWTSTSVALAPGRHRFTLEYLHTGEAEAFLNCFFLQGHIERGKKVPLVFWTGKE